MNGNFRIARILGISLELHWSWLFIAGLIALSLAAHFHAVHPSWTLAATWGTALVTGALFFVGLLLHEMAHALVARARGLPIRRITLFALGGMAQIEKEAEDAASEFWIALAGPATSVALGLGLLYSARAAGWMPSSTPATPVISVIVWLGYINVMLAAFNMIPGFPLDGGRVLRAIVWLITKNARKATLVAARVGQLVALAFIGWGIFRFFTGAGFNGMWLALIGWFLLNAAGTSVLQVEAARLLRGLRARDLMSQDCAVVDANASVEEFAHHLLLRTARRCFMAEESGRIIGLLTLPDLRRLPRDRWEMTPVREIVVPLEKVARVRPDTPVKEALEMMVQRDVNQVPVMSDGRLEGVLSRAHILQLLETRAEIQKRAA